ncbi:disease resistance protein RGA4-like [Triticum dicoccoides]|uniref:disease resistance protein RGA4-like n=1 Tax=Triticum dicoccoides TaxID=85692 RepID=UPI001891CA1F|nr:disease resistance protein RGA4-like [Triticum dicoccoides]
MAEFALGLTKTAVEGTVSRVKSAIDEEAKLRIRVQNDLVFITGEFEMMQSFLNAANKIDVEDCLEFVVHLDNKSTWSWLWRVLPDCMAPVRPLDVAVADIQRLKARVEDVSQRNTRYNLIGDSGSHSNSKPTVVTTVSSLTTELMPDSGPAAAFRILHKVWEATDKIRPDMGDLRKLITNEGSDLEVISVCGSPGASDLGVTHVLREAYNDPKICQEFTSRAWVHQNLPFNLNEFIKILLTQFYASSNRASVGVAGFRKNMKEAVAKEDELMQQVSQLRYLVIVEQLSSVVEWDAIRMYLPESKNGSRIVVTTKQLGLAFSCTGNPYQVSNLRQLSGGQSLCAFFNKVSERRSDMGELIWQLRHVVGVISVQKHPDLRSSTLIDKVYTGKKGYSDKDKSNAFSIRMVEARDWINKFESIKDYSGWNPILEFFPDGSPPHGVTSMWGIAGVGKSAPVRSFYYKSTIGDLEPVRKYSWVDVPQPFDLTDFCRQLYMDFNSDDLEEKETAAVRMIEGQDPIQGCRKFLQEDDYFVVFDGLCSIHDWDQIKEVLLSEPIKGSIFVITNEKGVATHCVDDREDRVFNVKGLGADTALALFTKMARSGKLIKTSREEELSKLIIAKCGGLPKVIAAIGESLQAPYKWDKKLLESLNAKFMIMLETDPRFQCLRGLFTRMQSYFDGCPDSLKPCIFYLSVFPLGHIIRRRRLLRRWIAEGYSRGTNCSTAEENAEKYFSQLVELSIIIQQQQEPPSSADVWKVNGFFREYIISRPMQDNLVFALEGRRSHNWQALQQHLAISSSWDGDKIVFERMELSRLRSLTVFGKWRPFFISAYVNMELLRVLDLENSTGVRDADIEQIGKLVLRLKFLSLRGCKYITCLPRSLAGLKQLQTLDVKGTSIVILPSYVMKLHKLQYIRAGAILPPSVTEDLPAEEAGAADEDHMTSATAGDDHSDAMVTSQLAGEARTPAEEEPVQTTTPWSSRGRDMLVSCSCGKAILMELKKLTQLHKLAVSGINWKNWSEFCSVISGYVHLETLSVRLGDNDEKQKEREDLCCLDDISKPPKTLKSLKLYKLVIVFGGRMPANVEVLVVHCSSTESSLELSGLEKLENLKEVWLKGSYSDQVKEHLQQKVGELVKKPVLKLEDQHTQHFRELAFTTAGSLKNAERMVKQGSKGKGRGTGDLGGDEFGLVRSSPTTRARASPCDPPLRPQHLRLVLQQQQQLHALRAPVLATTAADLYGDLFHRPYFCCG